MSLLGSWMMKRLFVVSDWIVSVSGASLVVDDQVGGVDLHVGRADGAGDVVTRIRQLPGPAAQGAGHEDVVAGVVVHVEHVDVGQPGADLEPGAQRAGQRREDAEVRADDDSGVAPRDVGQRPEQGEAPAARRLPVMSDHEPPAVVVRNTWLSSMAKARASRPCP